MEQPSAGTCLVFAVGPKTGTGLQVLGQAPGRGSALFTVSCSLASSLACSPHPRQHATGIKLYLLEQVWLPSLFIIDGWIDPFVESVTRLFILISLSQHGLTCIYFMLWAVTRPCIIIACSDSSLGHWELSQVESCVPLALPNLLPLSKSVLTFRHGRIAPGSCCVLLAQP